MLWKKDIKNKTNISMTKAYHSVFPLWETGKRIVLWVLKNSYVYLDKIFYIFSILGPIKYCICIYIYIVSCSFGFKVREYDDSLKSGSYPEIFWSLFII